MNRALGLAALVVVANAAGNFALNWGMKHGGMLAAWTLTGIGLLILWTLLRIRLLGLADLSYVLPITSVGYLLPLLLGYFVLHEQVSPARWLGGALIVGGAALVSPSRPKTS